MADDLRHPAEHANAAAELVTQVYGGWVPLSVRYGLGNAALDLIAAGLAEHEARRVDHDSFIRCRDVVLKALRAEMANRDETGFPAWVARERFIMAFNANLYADAHGMVTITVDDIAGFEHLAEGHIDYASKIALYVSEWVHGRRGPGWQNP